MRSFKPFVLLFLITLALTTSLKSQEPLKHKKKIYRAEDGKLYANKSLPIYFRIATSSEDDAESFLLMPAEDSKKYANPMYFNA